MFVSIISYINWIRCKTAALKTNELYMNAPISICLALVLVAGIPRLTQLFATKWVQVIIACSVVVQTIHTSSRIFELDMLASSQIITSI